MGPREGNIYILNDMPRRRNRKDCSLALKHLALSFKCSRGWGQELDAMNAAGGKNAVVAHGRSGRHRNTHREEDLGNYIALAER